MKTRLRQSELKQKPSTRTCLRSSAYCLLLTAVCLLLSAYCLLTPPLGALAQTRPRDAVDTTELNQPVSEMRGVIEHYTADRGSLTRSFPVSLSPARQARFRQFYSDWLATLPTMAFDTMSQDGKVDYLLFKNHLEYELRQLDIQAKQLAEIEPLIPFAKSITDLEEARRRMEPINSA